MLASDRKILLDNGFTVTGTGGNCTAWEMRDANSPAVYWITAEGRPSHDIREGESVYIRVHPDGLGSEGCGEFHTKTVAEAVQACALGDFDAIKWAWQDLD
jgi:hypothetical protein